MDLKQFPSAQFARENLKPYETLEEVASKILALTHEGRPFCYARISDEQAKFIEDKGYRVVAHDSMFGDTYKIYW